MNDRPSEIEAAARALLLSKAGQWVFGTPEGQEVEAEVRRLRVALGICLTCHGTGVVAESMDLKNRNQIPCPDCDGRVEELSES